MTLPAEGISSTNYDVVTVEHFFSDRGFLTQASMVNTADTRKLPASTMNEIIQARFNIQNTIAKGIRMVK